MSGEKTACMGGGIKGKQERESKVSRNQQQISGEEGGIIKVKQERKGKVSGN